VGGRGTYGTVFKLSRQSDGTWVETILHAFSANDGTDLQGGLRMDAHGNLFGTTVGGGNYGSGVVFELQPQPGGIYSFAVHSSLPTLTASLTSMALSPPPRYSSTMLAVSSAPPHSAVLGRVHTTGPPARPAERSRDSFPAGCGTVFKLTPQSNGSWSKRILYNFQGGADGGFPVAGVIRDANGVFYGATWQGGGGTNPNCDSYYDTGCGVVFSLSSYGAGHFVEKVLYTFQGQSDGANPIATLLRDRLGNLYGTTNGLIFGSYQNSTVFELSPAAGGTWPENTLYSFDNRR